MLLRPIFRVLFILTPKFFAREALRVKPAIGYKEPYLFTHVISFELASALPYSVDGESRCLNDYLYTMHLEQSYPLCPSRSSKFGRSSCTDDLNGAFGRGTTPHLPDG